MKDSYTIKKAYKINNKQRLLNVVDSTCMFIYIYYNLRTRYMSSIFYGKKTPHQTS